jgi:UDP-N-acetylmuramyl tripeptide synthase
MQLTPTLMVAKTAAGLSRLFRRGGGQALPGLISERMDPHLAAKLVSGLSHGVILVTGTNGKTTTTKMLAGMLAASGEKVLTNSTGSNLKRGITSALIRASDLNGKLKKYTIGLFEVDEATLRQIAPELQPNHIVVLNLFRDQLDRYGELDTTAALIGQGIAATKARIYLNADDPLVASLAKYAKKPDNVTFFGIEGLPSSAATAIKTVSDSDRCPVCHERMVFSRVFYGHIGHYRCPQGHFGRPRPSVTITNVEKADINGSSFTVAMDGKRSEVSLGLPGIYNLYNALAAMSVAHGLGLERGVIAAEVEKAEAAFGRVEKVTLEGRTIYLLLIKNPAGFTQVLDTFLAGKQGVRAMFAINDNPADGRDVSWLWDVPLEALAPTRPKLVVSGIRGTDMALRLHYAGLDSNLAPDFKAAIRELVQSMRVGETAYILPTYTAMLEIRKLLSKKTQMEEVWR